MIYYRNSGTGKICFMRRTILIILLIFTGPGSPDAREGNFSSYLRIFEYPEIREKITKLELREMNRTRVTHRGVSYPGRLIRLYLLSSVISDEETLGRYLQNFENKIAKARRIILEKGYDKKLNRYNLAEFLLHFLHNEYFRTEQRGRAAGYNIGIKETFDSGSFNCYKSALIYNAFLEYFDFRTGLISVPKHIYSLVDINGLQIDVETTNRYGFDPYNAGKGRYRRIFQKENIHFNVNYYREKEPRDNVSAVVQVFNNRSLLFSGDMSYSGIDVERDYSRAAALSLFGSYLSYNDERYIVENTLYKVFQLSKSIIDKSPEKIDLEYRRYSRILEHPFFTSFSGSHRYNLEVLAGNAVTGIRKRKIRQTGADKMQELLRLFINESVSAGRFIKKNRDIRNSIWNNSIVEFNSLLEKRYPPGNLENVKIYGRLILDMLDHPVFKNSEFIKKYLVQYRGNICILIDNLGIAELNRQNWRGADAIYREGLVFLQKELKINSGFYYRLLMKHHMYAKKNL